MGLFLYATRLAIIHPAALDVAEEEVKTADHECHLLSLVLLLRSGHLGDEMIDHRIRFYDHYYKKQYV